MAQDQYTRLCPLVQLPSAPPFHPDQLRHAQQGCPDCLNHLMAQHDPLVHWVLRRFGAAPLSFDEALQAGRYGLWQALLHFDPGHGTAFSSYAVPAILRQVRREGQQFRHFWRPRPVRLLTEEPTPLEQALAALERADLLQAVQTGLEHLPRRLAALLRARYGCGGRPPQLQRVLAQQLGVTRQRVQQLLHEAQLRLALPLCSWELRRLLGRTAPAEIQAALRAWQRFRRSQRRTP